MQAAVVLITLAIASIRITLRAGSLCVSCVEVCGCRRTTGTVVIWIPCTGAFPQEVRKGVQGVAAKASAWSAALSLVRVNAWLGASWLPDGRPVLDWMVISVDYGFLELHVALRPLAGRFSSRDHAGDSVTQDLADALGREVRQRRFCSRSLLAGWCSTRPPCAGRLFHSASSRAIGSEAPFASGRPLEAVDRGWCQISPLDTSFARQCCRCSTSSCHRPLTFLNVKPQRSRCASGHWRRSIDCE